MDGMILACRVIDLFLEAELVQKPDIHIANRCAAIDYTLHWHQFIPSLEAFKGLLLQS